MRSFICGCAALLALAAVAVADTQSKTDPKNDAKSVSNGKSFDFKSASVTHAGRDRFTHRVTGWSPAADAFPGVRLELAMSGESRPGYMVAKFDGKAGMYRYTRTGVKRIAPATFKKHSNKSFSLTFSVEPLGLPGAYRWRWVHQSPDAPGFIDALPNKGLVRHDLSSGHND